MKIRRHCSLELADKTLKLIEKGWKAAGLPTGKEDLEYYSLSCYANCREHGYAINRYGRDGADTMAVVFSGCRNSDSICIYIGKYTDFDTHNIPNERVYRYGRYAITPQEAAELILLTLVSWEATHA